MNASPRILIIRLSSLGDILHTLPAFTSLRATFPDSSIEWLTAKKSAFLLGAVPGIDSLHQIDTSSLLRFPFDRPAWSAIRRTVRDLRARRFDIAIDFQGLLKTAFLSFISGSRTRIGFSRELVRERPAHWFYDLKAGEPQERTHVLNLNRMLAELAGARRVSLPIDFAVAAADNDYVASLLKREDLSEFIIINPGGGWPTKRWDPARYGRLARRIQEDLHIPVAVTTGPGEEPLFRDLAEACGPPRPRHFPVSFLQLIPLLRKTRLFIGGDTGPFHLACALGTPVVGIFGPTSPVRNGPWTNGEEVLARKLPCSFCYGRTCPTNNECMDVGVSEVFSGVLRRLAGTPGFL